MRKKKRKNTDSVTIISANSNKDDIINDLMVNFLKKTYPIIKIKEKNRFRRGIMIDGKEFLLPRDNNMVFFALFSILDTLYGVHEDISAKAIENFYNL